eukprot:gene20323-26380_t
MSMKGQLADKSISLLSNVDKDVPDLLIGIPIEHQSKLFSKYMQIDANKNQGGKGTGVGLAICKEIINLHGGTVGCNSKVKSIENEETGSEFYFIIHFELPHADESGGEVISTLRSDGFIGLIVGLTGYVFHHDIQRFKDSGA